ncbi:MAG: hypothetical protein JWP87_5106 [Labilithrix sp.]|nr:hypothetical protein [Labilithrix sp.]
MNERLHRRAKSGKFPGLRASRSAHEVCSTLVVTRVIASTCLLLALGLLGACATTQVTTPRSRVAKDLGCTTEATQVEQIAPVPGEKSARWQVTGCGRTAVYLCTTPVRECWREGDIQQDAASR